MKEKCFEVEKIDIARNEDNSSYIDGNVNISELFSVKSIFIIVLFILAGLSMIFLMVINDDRIRTSWEMCELYNLDYIGSIDKKTQNEDILKIKKIFSYYCKKEDEKMLAVISMQPLLVIQTIQQKFSTNEINEHVLFWNSSDMLNALLKESVELKSVFVLIHKGKDRIGQLDDLLGMAETLGIKVVGYILCESLE